jgi:hypothetical protein
MPLSWANREQARTAIAARANVGKVKRFIGASGFRVQGFRVQGSGFRVQGSNKKRRANAYVLST